MVVAYLRVHFFDQVHVVEVRGGGGSAGGAGCLRGRTLATNGRLQEGFQPRNLVLSTLQRIVVAQNLVRRCVDSNSHRAIGKLERGDGFVGGHCRGRYCHDEHCSRVAPQTVLQQSSKFAAPSERNERAKQIEGVRLVVDGGGCSQFQSSRRFLRGMWRRWR